MEDDLAFEIAFCRGLLQQDSEWVEVLELLAHLCTRAGLIDEGLQLDRRIVALRPDSAIAHYNLACSLALKRRFADAVAALRIAVQKGYSDFGWMLRDPDLQGLQEYEPFGVLLAELQKTHLG